MDETIQNRVKNNKFKKQYISIPKRIKVNQSNLIELLFWVDKNSITYKNGQFVLTQDNHIVVYPNMTYNHYTGESFNPLNTLMEYYGYSFPQAFYVANHFVYKVGKLAIHQQIEAIQAEHGQHEQHDVDLNYILEADLLHSTSPSTKAAALARAYAYLVKTRGIDRDLVSHIIHKRLLGMDLCDNLCFFTYRGDKVIAVTKKGTNPYRPFKQNLVAEKHTGFFYGSSTVKEFKEVYVFEAVVDLLSYITLFKCKAIPAPSMDTCYISTNGVSRKYLHKVLEEHPTINAVHFCYDNDKAGIKAASDFMFYDARNQYKDRLTADTLVDTLKAANVKDWNEYLKYIEEKSVSA